MSVHESSLFLAHKAYLLRKWSLIQTSQAGSGHPSSCLSAADIVAVLFFDVMSYDPHNPENPDNDRFILSKGHAAPILYAAWKEVGVLSEKDLLAYRDIHSPLEGHPTMRFSHNEAATGSLGMGLSIGVGIALNARLDRRTYKTYVLMGDSEIAEGSIWEAAELARYYALDNLVGIVDINRLGQSTVTMLGHHADHYAAMFEAFGWHTMIIDGHDIDAIRDAFVKADEVVGKPTMILAHTKKGYGVDTFSDKEGFHGKALSKEDLSIALEQLKKNFPAADAYQETLWKPKMPPMITSPWHDDGTKKISMPACSFKKGEKIATRKSYGQSLAILGGVCDIILSLDAEVKNSTFADIFERAYPERFFQCFIAEQNMVSMAVGLNRRKKIPFVSTFGAFFTRAFDQIRMAAIGNSSIRLVGSHCGVSIGQDGPSQMALEDLAIMRTLPDSIVLYPSDAVSTYRLIECMANYHEGISYMRTTREDTPVIYDNNEQFPIGGCKIVRQAIQAFACIVAAGITLFEALKAAEKLAHEGIEVSVLDLYSIKPVDEQMLLRMGVESSKIIITVEDHYLQGGLGDVVVQAVKNTDIRVHCLAVTKLPRSGKPAELLAWVGIDAHAIAEKVRALAIER